MLLCLPMFTDVLSTDKLTQIVQGIPCDSRALFIAVKILAAVAELVPVVKHIPGTYTASIRIINSYNNRIHFLNSTII